MEGEWRIKTEEAKAGHESLVNQGKVKDKKISEQEKQMKEYQSVILLDEKLQREMEGKIAELREREKEWKGKAEAAAKLAEDRSSAASKAKSFEDKVKETEKELVTATANIVKMEAELKVLRQQGKEQGQVRVLSSLTDFLPLTANR